MRSIVIGFVLLIASGSILADSHPSRQLVEEYLRRALAEEAVSAEIEGYVQQLGANASPEEKARISEYLNGSMGWSVIKNQYASLVERIYTTEELKASMAFVKTPVGASVTKKNQRFAQEMAVLIAKNSQRATGELEAQKQSGVGESRLIDSALGAINIEEHKIDGRVYFTGEVENRGKRPARGVQVEVNLFSAGKFVDQYTTYISGVVLPGMTRYFKVSCGCKDSPPAVHDSIKTHVNESY